MKKYISRASFLMSVVTWVLLSLSTKSGAQQPTAQDAAKFIAANDNLVACGGMNKTHYIFNVTGKDGKRVMMMNSYSVGWSWPHNEPENKHCEVDKDDAEGFEVTILNGTDNIQKRYNQTSGGWYITFHCSPDVCDNSKKGVGEGTIVLERSTTEVQAEKLVHAWKVFVLGLGAPLVDDSKF